MTDPDAILDEVWDDLAKGPGDEKAAAAVRRLADALLGGEREDTEDD